MLYWITCNEVSGFHDGDAHAKRPHLVPQTVREPFDAVLGDDVGRPERNSHPSQPARHVHDATYTPAAEKEKNKR